MASVVTMRLGREQRGRHVAHHQPLVGGAAAEAAALLGRAGHGAYAPPLLRRARPRSSSFWQHLVEGLLAEVGDGQQVVLGLVDQLADGVDLGPLEAVAGTLGQVELLDGQVEVGRAAAQHADVAQLEGLGGVAHLGHQADQGPQGGAGRGQRLTGRDGPVGLDVEGEAVVVGGLLDPGGLDGEGDPAHRARRSSRPG